MVGIYGLKNKITGKWYIGQSIDIGRRWKSYDILHCKGQPKIYAALHAYGKENFDKIIIELCDRNIPLDVLIIKESAWIEYYNSVENGYNIRKNASKIDIETRKKISIALTGRTRSPFTEIAKKNMSLAKVGKNNYWYNKTLSEEHRNNLSKANSGRVLNLSPEERLRRSERAAHMNNVKKLKRLTLI